MDMFTSYGHIKLRSQKNTDFLMILAWLCRFNLYWMLWEKRI